MSSSAQPVPPSPSWIARLTRSPGAAAVRRPPQRNFDEAGADHHLLVGSRRRQSLLVVRPSQGVDDEDDGESDDHGDHDEEGGMLSTSSLGRNHRLSFLGLLAPTSGMSHNLVRMSSQPPTRYGGSASRGGDTATARAKPKPFLSMSLLKLNEILPAYCRALVDPDQGASKACSLLDSGLATATWSPSASPSSARRSGEEEEAQIRKRRDHLTSTGSSPSTSLFGNLLSARAAALSSSPPSSSSNSAMAIEGEWESYTAPFFLLAAADILYYDMNHCFLRHEEECGAMPDAHPHAAALSRLYRRIVDDIVGVKQILCDPLIGTLSAEGEAVSHSPGLISSSVQRSKDAARTLSVTLELLVAVCKIRSQLVTFQSQLFASAATFVQRAADSETDRHVTSAGERKGSVPSTQAPQPQMSPSTCLAEALKAVNRILHAIPEPPAAKDASHRDEDSSSTGAQVLYQSTVRECYKWKHCLEAACGLDRCRFYDTLLSLRSFKGCLREHASHPKSRLNLWFLNTYDRIVALLPVYFDRIQAFSAPLYGCDTSALLRGKRVDAEWNAAVLEVLRRQEKSGTPMAILLVLDAESAGTADVQQGLRLASLPSPDASEPDGDRVRWPALYVRSTLHLTSGAQSSSRPSLTQGSSGYLNSSSQGSILQNWSISGNPSASSLVSSASTKVPIAFSKASVLEYAPESGIAAWPHSEWHRLSTLLRNHGSYGTTATDVDSGAFSRVTMSAVTYRDYDEDDARPSHVLHDSTRSLHDGSGLLGASASFDGSPRKPPPADPTSKEKPSSVFHTCPVSDFLTLVAIVDVEGDDHRWRRRSGLTDQEIRDVLVEFALQLSVVRNFTVYNIPSNQQDNAVVKSLRYSFKASQTQSAHTAKSDATSVGSSSALTDEFVRGFLRDLKMALGLRPVNPLAHDALRSTATLSPTSRRFLSQRASTVSASSPASSLLGFRRSHNRPFDKEAGRFDESALNLFLGSDLASMFA